MLEDRVQKRLASHREAGVRTVLPGLISHVASSPDEKGSDTCAILFRNRSVGTV
jgi:hypothetical protein